MADDLYGLLSGILHGMSHAQMSHEPERVAGLVVPAPEGFSKRQRIEAVLENLTQEDLARLALKFAAVRRDIPLDEAGRKVLEAGDPPLPQHGAGSMRNCATIPISIQSGRGRF